MILCYIISFIILIAGIIFYTGKGANCIKGYRMMTEKEKKSIDIKALCKNLSVMFFIMAGIYAIAGYFETFRVIYLIWEMIGWMVICCADILYINKSKRYVTNTEQDNS